MTLHPRFLERRSWELSLLETGAYKVAAPYHPDMLTTGSKNLTWHTVLLLEFSKCRGKAGDVTCLFIPFYIQAIVGNFDTFSNLTN